MPTEPITDRLQRIVLDDALDHIAHATRTIEQLNIQSLMAPRSAAEDCSRREALTRALGRLQALRRDFDAVIAIVETTLKKADD